MSYQPGTHLIATLRVPDAALLQRAAAFRDFLHPLIDDAGLQRLGDVYHDFEPGGFTAVVCLSESHLSVHTWPEHGLLNMDIYLSNHLRSNDGTVHHLFQAIQNYFGAEVVQEQSLKR
ncbi:S-adenosylmethionine decarboxylase [Flaviaesturariibacter amylovorans]|uniref:S-adenosylmethionine decarboxylase n=1 Tax=Flaviaesturariibacter amylovorans TaxID=1084520 RepID=A0ABP8GYY3_9BACT